MTKNPLYTHDCTECTYLGAFEGIDLYLHNVGDEESWEMVCRSSDEPEDYYCLPWFADLGEESNFDKYREIKKRALAQMVKT